MGVTRPFGFALILVAAGCTQERTSDPVLLRFVPELGNPLAYELTVDLDKTTYGRAANEHVSAVMVLTPESRLADGYAVTMTAHVNSHNLDDLIAEHMMRKIDAGKALTISDGFVFSGEDGPSLYFPETPVSVGDTWEAESVFAFGDLTTLEPPTVRWRFTLLGVTPDGATAQIKVELLTREAEVPFQMGRAGIQCEEDGTIAALDGDAADQLRVGDRIIAIGGQPAPDARTRSILAQNFIEDLNIVDQPVQLTAVREGKELNVSVAKTVVYLGTIDITFRDYARISTFNPVAGVLKSDDSSAEIELRYTFAPEIGFLDDLGGGNDTTLENASGTDDVPRIYRYYWTMDRLSGTG